MWFSTLSETREEKVGTYIKQIIKPKFEELIPLDLNSRNVNNYVIMLLCYHKSSPTSLSVM